MDVSASPSLRGLSSTRNINLSSPALERTQFLRIFWGVALGMYGGMETQFHLIYLRVNSPWCRFDGVIVSAFMDLVEKKVTNPT